MVEKKHHKYFKKIFEFLEIVKECNAGFNFARENQAKEFYATITKRIALINKQVREKTKETPPAPAAKKKIEKSEIGGPMGFVHLTHVGFSSDKLSLNVPTSNDENSEFIKKLLAVWNVPIDHETVKIVDKLIKDNGGIEKLKQEIASPPRKAPPPPSSAIKGQNNEPSLASSPPPPPPSRSFLPPAPPCMSPPALKPALEKTPVEGLSSRGQLLLEIQSEFFRVFSLKLKSTL